ncbi:MAG TPA: ChbG/HpnK family deacetylase [Bryobacteraceae bacterium]|nr:ChbG/HpnK family deacetylase [Bryobacteraceae bacterium]
MSSRKQLVINADDFGFTPDVNEGIIEAHCYGILTATTIMANGAAFDHAAGLARQSPGLDVGCHLVLVGGRSLVSGAALPASVARLLRAIATRQMNVYDELRTQVTRIIQAGLEPSHLDTHKHTHLAPPVLEAVARLGEEFSIPWVRRPMDFPLSGQHGAAASVKRLTSAGIGLLRGRFHRVLEEHHCRTTDYFAGFQITGRLRTKQLVELMAVIPEGSTELMCHPGRCGEELRNAPTRLKESREAELAALTAPEVREAVKRAGIELVNYRQLADAPL